METKVIISATDNDGNDNAAIVDRASRCLCALFGGATVYVAKGLLDQRRWPAF